MFFKNLIESVREQNIEAMRQTQRPIQPFVVRIYSLFAIGALLFNLYMTSLGLHEVLTWLLWGAGISPVLFLLALWDVNLPKDEYCAWPKAWRFRSHQIWPRQN